MKLNIDQPGKDEILFDARLSIFEAYNLMPRIEHLGDVAQAELEAELKKQGYRMTEWESTVSPDFAGWSVKGKAKKINDANQRRS